MKPITEQERQELIADCVREIERLEKTIRRIKAMSTDFDLSRDERKLSVHKIALASLNAVPVGYISDSNLKVLGKGAHSVYVKPNPAMIRPNAIYTAPPVTVIKLPEKLNVGEIHYELTENYGVGISLDQLERGLADEVYSIAVNTFEHLNGLGE